jgi:hypothetical protein
VREEVGEQECKLKLLGIMEIGGGLRRNSGRRGREGLVVEGLFFGFLCLGCN